MTTLDLLPSYRMKLSIQQLGLQLSMVLATMLLFIAVLALSEGLFTHLVFTTGINYVYLPGGVRLLCTLLFAEAGAIGLLLVSWLVCFFYFFPEDYPRAFMGGVLAALAPYMAYRASQHYYGIGASLANLTPQRLLVLSVVYSLASPLLHHVWFVLHGDEVSLSSFVVMFVGDLSGTLLVLYGCKALLSFLPKKL